MSSSSAPSSTDSSTLSSLEILKLYSSGGLYLDESNLYLSGDGKELFFLGGGSSTLPVATRNATEENVLESYTLASIYLLCIYPNDLRSYRKSCDRANCTAVKTTDKPKILTALLGEEYYNKVLQQQQPAIESTSSSNRDRDRKKHEAESSKRDHREKPHERSHKKHHHRDHHGTTTSSSSKHKDHHHHTHKSSSSHKEVTSSSNKRSKTLSKDQVLENLTLVVDKKWDKKYQMQQPTEEETPMKGDSEDHDAFQTPNNNAITTPHPESTYTASSTAPIVTAAPTPAGVAITEEEELKKTLQLRELLADKSSIVTDDELLANDLQKTNVITSMEIPVGDSLSILRAPGRDLSRVLEMYNEAMKQEQQQKRKGLPSKLSSSASSLKAKDNGKDSSKSKANANTTDVPMKPIIVVPNTMTSPITLLNAVEFFSQGTYVSRETILKQRSAAAAASSSMAHNTAETLKQQSYTFTRKVPSMYLSSSGGIVPKGVGSNLSNASSAQLEYEIIDNPRKFLRSRQDWDRIVAVVALGASWQFKDWPGKFQIPVELFNRVQGYYFGIQDNTSIPKEAKGWNMQTILLARNNRSADKIAHAKFWNTLDEWMSIHKPELLPSSMET